MSGSQARALVLVGLIAICSVCLWLFTPRATVAIDSYASCANEGYPVSDTNPPACNDGAHTFVGPMATPPPSLAPVTVLDYQVLVDGDSKGSYPRTQQVISNQAGWSKYWNAVHAALPSIPPILPVDFSNYSVIAINEGPEATDGYSLAVTSVAAGASGTIVNIMRTVPVTACKVDQQNSNEYLIVETPKLTDPVSFDMTTQPRHC
jgi:hypothetical protein